MFQKVTEADINKIEKSATNIYHLLRHYSECDSLYTNKLIGQEYEYYDYDVGEYRTSYLTKKDISDAYETPGSKFFTNVPSLENPSKLIDVIVRETERLVALGTLEWIEELKYKKAEFMYTHNENIGFRGVVDISELTVEEIKKIKRIPRGNENVLINFVSGVNKIQTNQMVIGLYERCDTRKLYITAFPGFICPALPSVEQSNEERNKSEEFWDREVFVE